MRRQLIRAALFLYPASWRRRYGGELEQMMLDYGADNGSLAGSAWMLIELSGSGLVERARSSSLSVRIATVALVCAASAMAVDASALNRSTSSGAGFRVMNGTVLASDATLPASSKSVHLPARDFPGDWARNTQTVTVWYFEHSSKVMGLSGPPVSVTMNPKTNTIVKVKANRVTGVTPLFGSNIPVGVAPRGSTWTTARD
jgi:hypothetical protein